MDYFAHGFWSYILFHSLKNPWLAVLFGILPDTISWLPYFFYRAFTGTFGQGPPNAAQIPDIVWMMYGISHSLLVFTGVAIVIYIVAKNIPIYVWAWPIHILIDIPTHRQSFLPTPFLWPVSDYAFPGISWSNPVFATINYSLIFIFLAYIIIKKRQKR